MPDDPITPRLLSELVRLRRSAGLTQRAIAEAVGISPSAVSNIEAGRRGTTVEVIEAWAGACDGLVRAVPVSEADPLQALSQLDRALVERLTGALPKLDGPARVAIDSMIAALSSRSSEEKG